MKRITYLFMLLASVFLLFVLACGVATPSPISNTIKNQPTSTMEVKAKPTNAPKMQNGYSTTVTAEKWLYVRSSASHYAEVVGYLMNGEYVIVYECRGTWGRVGTGRWVNTVYLDKGCE